MSTRNNNDAGQYWTIMFHEHLPHQQPHKQSQLSTTLCGRQPFPLSKPTKNHPELKKKKILEQLIQEKFTLRERF